MYKNQYPSLFAALKKRFPISARFNFEVVIGAITEHFSDLFDMAVLEAQAQDQDEKASVGSYWQFFEKASVGSYWQFFNDCMSWVCDAHTKEEVVEKLHIALSSDDSDLIKNLQRFILLPCVQGKLPKQIGILEKLATGNIKHGESLSLLDMRRFLHGASHLITGRKASGPKVKVEVGHLHYLRSHSTQSGSESTLDAAKRRGASAFVINFNLDPKGPPKWGVIDLRGMGYPGNTKARVYCESVLTENEKIVVQSLLGKNLIEKQFLAREGGTTKGLPPSTGYSALAWLDIEITKSWHFDINADFTALLDSVLFVYVGGDADEALDFSVTDDERSQLTGDFLSICQTYSQSLPVIKCGKFIPKLTRISVLPEAKGEESRLPGDLKATLQCLADKTVDYIDEQSDFAGATALPGLDHTLRNMQWIQVDNGVDILLTIPDDSQFKARQAELFQENFSVCNARGADDNLLKNYIRGIVEKKVGSSRQNSLAILMLCSFIRNKAKQPVLNIMLPDCQLHELAIKMMVHLLKDNAYVTQFNNVSDNVSLKQVKSELAPIFARNRWLNASGYLPPMQDDYWARAANYWILHLHERLDASDPVKDGVFKSCVLEMGATGLDAVLSFLKNPSHLGAIQNAYGKSRPVFYLAFPAKDYAKSINSLLAHFAAEAYFPFSELEVAYQPGNDNELANLLSHMNWRGQFEQMTLTGCKDDPDGFGTLLDMLIQTAGEESWQGLIAIPELRGKEQTSEQFQILRARYVMLNNVILRNRYEKLGAHMLQELKEASPTEFKSTPSPIDESKAEGKSRSRSEAPEVEERKSSTDDLKRIIDNAEEDSWSLHKGGEVKLQLQQQMQIEQQRQVPQKLQQKLEFSVEEAITGRLVDYDNIGELMHPHVEHELESSGSEALAGGVITEQLQQFFKDCISANPEVKGAKYVVQKITLDAAKFLWKKRGLLGDGLNPDNLPKGFFTQRSKDGQLILCYDIQKGYIRQPNPLTLDLRSRASEGVDWEGDFRQLDMNRYLSNVIDLKVTTEIAEYDWSCMALFALLQQPKETYEEDFNAFCEKNSEFFIKGLVSLLPSWFTGSGLTPENQRKIKENWPIFIQAWQYAGKAGVQAFLKRVDFDLSIENALTLLLKDVQELEIFKGPKVNESYLRAMAQVRYRYGDAVLSRLLNKFAQVKTLLGDEFFEAFEAAVLEKSQNFNDFMTPECFQVLDSMIKELSPEASKPRLVIWQSILTAHSASTGFVDVPALWKAFRYFESELQQMGLKPNGVEFRQIGKHNMLVYMDRLIAMLKRIPSVEGKKGFLKTLSTIDMSHGGVYYALEYEGFKHCSSELSLTYFQQGEPTYSPDLSNLYSWGQQSSSPLQIHRVLASQVKFTYEDYRYLSDGNIDTNNGPHELIWLLHLRSSKNTKGTLEEIRKVKGQFLAEIGAHLHKAVYERNNHQLDIQQAAIVDLETKVPEEGLGSLLGKYPDGNFLEAYSTLFQCRRQANYEKLMELFNGSNRQPEGCSQYFYGEGYQVATLFGVYGVDDLREFYKAIDSRYLKPAAALELRLMLKQLRAINYFKSTEEALARLGDEENWGKFLEAISYMNQNPHQAAKYRIDFMNALKGIAFTFSTAGDFRAMTDEDKGHCKYLGDFVDHEARLWNFLKGHIAVSAKKEAQVAIPESVQPIIQFFRGLQLNQTYLNEVEPLLASLEKTGAGKYWDAGYFYGLLRALQADDGVAFPTSLLKVLLEEPAIAAQPIDSLSQEFPQVLHESIQLIVKNTVFSRDQRTILCQLALRDFDLTGKNTVLLKISNTLAGDLYAGSRGYILALLEKRPIVQVEAQFNSCMYLSNLSQSDSGAVRRAWAKTTERWLRSMNQADDDAVMQIFNQIQAKFNGNNKMQALAYHIIGYSSLRSGAGGEALDTRLLKRKAPKLIGRLSRLTVKELTALAGCYPQDPSPAADTVLRFIKSQKPQEAKQEISDNLAEGNAEASWEAGLDALMRNPTQVPRPDYGAVVSTRHRDLQRMMKEAMLTVGSRKARLETEDLTKLTLMFKYLKQLEDGEQTIEVTGVGSKKVSEMSQEELTDAFWTLSTQSKEAPRDDSLPMHLPMQVWAVLFEVMGRTTGKYPHLAQQFALIADEVCINSRSRILQLATGEGKSHFVALRALRLLGQGKKVDICTAKRTLAQRDLEDYESLFSYLGIKTAYIHPKSSAEEFEDSQVHYSTIGDLSLFLDEQKFNGHFIEMNPHERVALFDEFDFIYFDEGRKTAYNYARPIGKTPKQMNWFYQAVNAFYKSNKEGLGTGKISKQMLKNFSSYLEKTAVGSEDRQNLIELLIREPMDLVQWIQSSYEAHRLEMGVGFTVQEINIEVGEESYPMREIIPLSSDNQKMSGSTFSTSVHQLLAVRLNEQAKEEGASQNFHVHAESSIISSQVAKTHISKLWSRWEGFSGTISPAQARALHESEGTQVLHVPTNQRDLRQWHKPAFFSDGEKRMDAMVDKIRGCLAKKQSVLFSCKDDKAVKALQANLKERLTESEFKQFKFYTNEEKQTAAEVLREKREMEGWDKGTKGQAVVLAASGFGRGDNVGVEAVFLFDVSDNNDKHQKGGRTARNGKEGEVFQFYLSSDLQVENAALLARVGMLTQSTESEDDSKSSSLAGSSASSATALKAETPTSRNLQDSRNQVPPKGDKHEQCFEQVMLLREYVGQLEDMPNQAYRGFMAQFSGWAMDQLAKLEGKGETDQKQQLTTLLSFRIRSVEKQWAEILGKTGQSLEGKISQIKEVVENQISEFVYEYAKIGVTLENLSLDEFDVTTPELIIPEVVEAPDLGVILMTKIHDHMIGLRDFKPNAEQMKELPTKLEKLKADQRELAVFQDRLAQHGQTFAGFLKELDAAVAKAEEPHKAWHELSDGFEISRENFSKGFESQGAQAVTLFEEFKRLVDGFGGATQKEITAFLEKKMPIDKQTRVARILPIVRYLSKFSDVQEATWDAAYIRNLEALYKEVPINILTKQFADSVPMEFDQFNTLFLITRSLKVPKDQMTVFLDVLHDAIKEAPEARLRMMSQPLTWTISMLPEQRRSFVSDFCRVMAGCHTEDDWILFSKLVRQTDQWWIQNDGKYKEEVMSLWSGLRQLDAQMPDISEFVEWGLSFPGKLWFQVLREGLKQLSVAQMSDTEYLKQFRVLFSHLDELKGVKKSEVTRRVETTFKGLRTLSHFFWENWHYLLFGLVVTALGAGLTFTPFGGPLIAILTAAHVPAFTGAYAVLANAFFSLVCAILLMPLWAYFIASNNEVTDTPLCFTCEGRNNPTHSNHLTSTRQSAIAELFRSAKNQVELGKTVPAEQSRNDPSGHQDLENQPK